MNLTCLYLDMMTNNISVTKKLFFVFLVIAGLYYAQEFLIPLVIATILATLFLPFSQWMETKKLPRGAAAFICLLLLLIFIAGIGALISWQVMELTTDFALLKQKALETTNHIQQYILHHFGISIAEQSRLVKAQEDSVKGIIEVMAGSVLSIFTGFILMLVYVFLLLYYRGHIKNFILKLSLPEQQAEMNLVILNATKVSQQYLVGLAKMIFCLWIMYGIGFLILGVKSAIFFAIFCGLLEIVPFIGNLTGTTITVLVTAVNGAPLPILGGIVITYGVVQLIQGWVLEPLILGPQVKINPLFTIIALVVGELMWGIPGIVLAIPLTGILKIVCDHIVVLKPYGFLIGEIETAKAESGLVKKIKSWWSKITHKPS